MRIMDVDARKMTSAHDDGAPHPGRESVLVSLKGSFHGRTDRPAQASDSCQPAYRKYLASFRGDRQVLHTVEPNNVNQLREVFEEVRDACVCVGPCGASAYCAGLSDRLQGSACGGHADGASHGRG